MSLVIKLPIVHLLVVAGYICGHKWCEDLPSMTSILWPLNLRNPDTLIKKRKKLNILIWSASLIHQPIQHPNTGNAALVWTRKGGAMKSDGLVVFFLKVFILASTIRSRANPVTCSCHVMKKKNHNPMQKLPCRCPVTPCLIAGRSRDAEPISRHLVRLVQRSCFIFFERLLKKKKKVKDRRVNMISC